MNEISAKLLNAELQLTQMKNTAEQLRGRAEEAAALSQKLADVRHAHLFTIHNSQFPSVLFLPYIQLF